MSRISLHKLQLFQFKNYDAFAAHFGPRVNCLLGKNGIGKTNILDAIYSLSFCKSYFSHTDSFSIQDEKEQGAANGEYEIDDENIKISYALFRDKKKQVSKNGKTYDRLSEHIGVLPLVMVTPNDIDLIREASDVRRRWLDQTLSQTSSEYLRLLIQFNHILDQRNAVLKNNRYGTSELSEIISIYNEQINYTGTQIFLARKSFFQSFSPVFESIYNEISQAEELPVLRYESEVNEENYLSLLEASLEKDKYAERTTKGIQKDDISFELQGKMLKKFASQGQQKTFLLALKLAQLEYTKGILNKSPLLILDDISEKLDDNRLRSLLQWLHENTNSQIFLSDTDTEKTPRMLAEVGMDFQSISLQNNFILPEEAQQP
jgi:DNA replication and repair protein RecF